MFKPFFKAHDIKHYTDIPTLGAFVVFNKLEDKIRIFNKLNEKNLEKKYLFDEEYKFKVLKAE